MLDVSLLTTTTCESVHFCSPADIDANREEIQRTARTYEVKSMVDSRAVLFRELAAAMHFPDYFGGNWDAVADCLLDIQQEGRRGIVLLIHHANELWKRQPSLSGQLIETWLGAAEEWRRKQVPFHLIFVW